MCCHRRKWLQALFEPRSWRGIRATWQQPFLCLRCRLGLRGISNNMNLLDFLPNRVRPLATANRMPLATFSHAKTTVMMARIFLTRCLAAWFRNHNVLVAMLHRVLIMWFSHLRACTKKFLAIWKVSCSMSNPNRYFRSCCIDWCRNYYACSC